MKKNVRENLADMRIDLIVFDFDGVMTDNRVYVDEEGKEGVFVSRAEGQGVYMLREAGYQMMILSTEENPVVEMRAKKLRLDVIHGVKEKGITLKNYCSENKIDLAHVIYVGNDVNDVAAMAISGLAFAPMDAEPEALEAADVIIEKRGGYGVARELARMILKQR